MKVTECLVFTSMKPRKKVQMKTKDLENGRPSYKSTDFSDLLFVRIYYLVSSILLFVLYHVQDSKGRNHCLWSVQYSVNILAAILVAIQPKGFY